MFMYGLNFTQEGRISHTLNPHFDLVGCFLAAPPQTLSARVAQNPKPPKRLGAEPKPQNPFCVQNPKPQKHTNNTKHLYQPLKASYQFL